MCRELRFEAWGADSMRRRPSGVLGETGAYTRIAAGALSATPSAAEASESIYVSNSDEGAIAIESKT